MLCYKEKDVDRLACVLHLFSILSESDIEFYSIDSLMGFTVPANSEMQGIICSSFILPKSTLDCVVNRFFWFVIVELG